MKNDMISKTQLVANNAPKVIAVTIALTICGIVPLNWWMSTTHYGETSNNVEIPNILINALMTILGYYFGNATGARKTRHSFTASFIAIVITLTVCGLIFANWWMIMKHYGTVSPIKTPDVLEHALSIILGYYFGSNEAKPDNAQTAKKGEAQ
jgi:flagellar basal body-associated protein FliL